MRILYIITPLTGEPLCIFGGCRFDLSSLALGCVEGINDRLSDAHPRLGGFLFIWFNIKILFEIVNELMVSIFSSNFSIGELFFQTLDFLKNLCYNIF